MIKFITALLLTPLCLAVLSAQADIENYTFHGSPNNNAFQFPGLDLNGDVIGKLNLKRNSPGDFPPSLTEFNILKLALSFDSAPELIATNFTFNPNTGGYITSINGAWVFRTVNVEVYDINLEQQQFSYRVSVETSKNLTHKNHPQALGEQVVLLESSGFLTNQTPFKLVDATNIIVNGKRLSIKLNGNMGSNNNPEKGMIGAGIELKLLWLGRGEKLLYIPAPASVKPVAIVVDTFNIDGDVHYEYFIRYEENNALIETPREPLLPRLDELFLPL